VDRLAGQQSHRGDVVKPQWQSRARKWWLEGFGSVVVVAVALTSGAAALDAVRTHPRALVPAMLFAAFGQARPVRLPSRRVLAPVATASALTLASLGAVHGEGPLDLPVAVIALVIAVGLGVGLLFGRRTRYVGGAFARLVALLTVATLARSMPIEGRSIWQWQQDPSVARWAAALALLLLSAAGLAVERLLSAVVQARRRHVRIAVVLRDERVEALPFTAALVATPPIATLIAPATGVLAIPLALTPVVLTLVAVRRYAAVQVTFLQMVRAVSRLTDTAGFTPAAHARRTAALVMDMGHRLGLSQREVRQVEYAALLHDVGQVTLRAPLPGGATVLSAPLDQERIARRGARIVRHGTGLEPVADLIEAQSRPHRAVIEHEESVPIGSRILKVANAFDDYTQGRRDRAAVTSAVERIHLGLGYEYDPAVVKALEDVARRIVTTD